MNHRKQRIPTFFWQLKKTHHKPPTPAAIGASKQLNRHLCTLAHISKIMQGIEPYVRPSQHWSLRFFFSGRQTNPIFICAMSAMSAKLSGSLLIHSPSTPSCARRSVHH
ncbi:unnamed protein product [Ceratitis capitata]|uniref:(Mediterranean fruit fly) hypothetical protein n=1 Tax=Ceratitis capitata TaxID=7213 RepID=A0A811TZX5_CERCA|nr:unnamed protein product [Ceratitis capitata]